MVKNFGGNRAKKFASKSFNVAPRATRFATEEGEVYAIVQRMLGSNICEILCIDGSTKLCVIRGKFSGKGKRDNKLAKGVWILVGLRSWQVTTKEKEKCDLLEVYTDADKEKLIKNSNQSFRAFISVSSEEGDMDSNHIKFINERDDEIFAEDEHEIGNEDNVEVRSDDERQEETLSDQLSWINIDDI